MLSAILYGITWMIYETLTGFIGYPEVPAIFLGVVTIMYLAAHFILLNASKKDPRKFVNAFMAVSGIKMFVAAGIIAGYVMSSIENVKINAVCFVAYYLVYLVVETIMMSKHLKRDASNNNNGES